MWYYNTVCSCQLFSLSDTIFTFSTCVVQLWPVVNFIFLYALLCYDLLYRKFVLLAIVRIDNKITTSFYYHVRLYCFTCSLDILKSRQSQEHNKTSLYKRFLKRNLAHVGIVQCMNALADKVQKQDVPCTQWYALHNMVTLFDNHPYISSSGFLEIFLWRLVSVLFW